VNGDVSIGYWKAALLATWDVFKPRLLQSPRQISRWAALVLVMFVGQWYFGLSNVSDALWRAIWLTPVAAAIVMLCDLVLSWFIAHWRMYDHCCDTIAARDAEMKNQSGRHEAEVSGLIEKLTSIVNERNQLREEAIAVPASRGDVIARFISFGREGQQLIDGDSVRSWDDCLDWYNRTRAFVELALHRHFVDDFEERAKPKANQADPAIRARQNLSGCIEFIRGFNTDKFKDDWMKSGLTLNKISGQ
jgi:hypothetical protein